MKRTTYNRIASLARYLAYIPLPSTWFAIIWADTFLVAVAIFLASFLPYLIGNNIIVRGWMVRKIDD
jgi:hypothetical protein